MFLAVFCTLGKLIFSQKVLFRRPAFLGNLSGQWACFERSMPCSGGLIGMSEGGRQ
jgi:hypothetical protein